jgi:hypothetical protein
MNTCNAAVFHDRHEVTQLKLVARPPPQDVSGNHDMISNPDNSKLSAVTRSGFILRETRRRCKSCRTRYATRDDDNISCSRDGELGGVNDCFLVNIKFKSTTCTANPKEEKMTTHRQPPASPNRHNSILTHQPLPQPRPSILAFRKPSTSATQTRLSMKPSATPLAWPLAGHHSQCNSSHPAPPGRRPRRRRQGGFQQAHTQHAAVLRVGSRPALVLARPALSRARCCQYAKVMQLAYQAAIAKAVAALARLLDLHAETVREAAAAHDQGG